MFAIADISFFINYKFFKNGNTLINKIIFTRKEKNHEK